MENITLVGLDTNIFMNVFKKEAGKWESSSKLLKQIEQGKLHGVTSTIVLAEIITLFYQNDDPKGGKKAFSYVTNLPNVSIVDFTTDIVDASASIKVKYKISLADATILASIVNFGADIFITRDTDFQNIDIIAIKEPQDIV